MIRQDSPQMEGETIINIGPICRFGPGGEYVSVWPAAPAGPAERPQNALAGLLNVLAGMIDALRGSPGTQRKPYYVSNDERAADSSTGSVVENNHRVSGQRWLFADDWRTGRTIRHKPHHCIRAHRAVAGKRICIGSAESRTLFDADCEVARTA